MGSNERKRKKNIRQSVYILIGLAFLIGVLFYARSLEQDAKHFRVWFKNKEGAETVKFSLEIAYSEPDREKGLMFRREMDPSSGMIFVFPDEQMLSFWMKNTYLSLDIIFVDKNWRVVNIIEEVPPLTTEGRRASAPSKYAIELIAGSAKKHGIVAGSEVKFIKPLPPPPTLAHGKAS